jgi:methylthioribulose 1-phosphate dehydratase / enolase-phosphatase E1
VDRASEVLFLTDIGEEATAARAAGLNVLLSVRPGNTPLALGEEYPRITSFDQVDKYIEGKALLKENQ